jgi:hypothetical protein
MPGLGEVLVLIVIIVAILYGTYRLGYRVGKAEGRLLGRDEMQGEAPPARQSFGGDGRR